MVWDVFGRTFISNGACSRFLIHLRLKATLFQTHLNTILLENASPVKNIRSVYTRFYLKLNKFAQPWLNAILFENTSPVKHSKLSDAFLLQNTFLLDLVNDRVFTSF